MSNLFDVKSRTCCKNMIGNHKICSICSLEPSTKGCVCDFDIILICKLCLDDHINDTYKDHNLVELDLALRMQADPSLVSFYLNERFEIPKLLLDLRSNADKVRRVKKQISDDKQRLISHIEEIFFEQSRDIDETDKQIGAKTRVLNKYKVSLCDEGRFLMEEYKISGFESIVKNSIENLDIPIDEIMRYLTHLITLENTQNLGNDEKDRAIEELNKKLSEKEIILKEYSDQIKQKDARIAELESEFNKRDDEILNQSSYMDELRESSPNEVQDLRNELKMKSNILSELEAQNELIDRLYAEINLLKRNEASLKSLLAQKEIDNKNIAENAKSDSKYANSLLLNMPNLGKNYIYIPSRFNQQILQYDVESGKQNTIVMPTLNRDFEDTSTCVLPNGDVMIAGFDNPISGEVYLYSVSSKEFITLPPLNYPRCRVALYYYREYVYAFGGVNSKRAERYSLLNNSWEILHDMNYPRGSLSCVGISDKIYLFKGGKEFIEAFNTISLNFIGYKIKSSDYHSSNFGVAYRLNDKIYLLSKNLIQIYDTKLTRLSEYSKTYKNKHYTVQNIAQLEKSIYYYNEYTHTIEKIDTSLPELEHQPYSENTQRYIYKTLCNSSIIHRIDLKHSTIEPLNFKNPNILYSNTSICLLDNGKVLIAGFDNPVRGDSYLYSPKNNTCKRLPKLKVPRYYSTLVYHNNYVYSFGGNSEDNTVSDAEKMHIPSKTKWIQLSNMMKERVAPSCVCMHNKIYIMGGNECSIEIYNIDTDSYQLSEVSLNCEDVASYIIDDKIHIIGDKFYQILNQDLEVISDYQDRYESEFPTYTFGNISYYKGKIFFFNDGIEQLERVDPITFDRAIQVINHTIV
jgi:hypothetical protein